MYRIASDITTLDQRLTTLFSNPERYRPERCPNCGWAKLWAHGCYTRKADRLPEGTGERNPVPILRFRCSFPDCRRTCSCLPACIAPRRWYPWAAQQMALALVLTGASLHNVEEQFVSRWRRGPVRSTIRRWLDWLDARGAGFAFRLKGRFPALARIGDGTPFWLASFETLGLAKVMAALDGLGEIVP